MDKLEKAIELLQRMRANPNDIFLVVEVDEFVYNCKREAAQHGAQRTLPTCPACGNILTADGYCPLGHAQGQSR